MQSQFPEPGDTYGTYRIEAFVDDDVTGRIFRAYDPAIDGTVCLKVLSDQIGGKQNFVDVLRIQCEAARGIHHPGIATVYDLVNRSGQYFFTYEWAGGGRLSHEIVERVRFPLSEALPIILQCADALNAAKKKGLFHGNLKPNNILMTPERTVKISEMGLAAAARAIFGPSNLPVYLGSARFLAPEMIREGSVDFRTDIYSLGMIFYYLLLNVVPFRYEGQKLTVEEKDQETVPQEVVELISRMTERDPGLRYQDYGTLIEDLNGLTIPMSQLVEIPTVGNLLGRGIKSPNLFKLLCALFVSGISGVLTVTQEDFQRKFYLRNRRLIFFESNRLEDSVWAWLVKKKEIDIHNKPDDAEEFSHALNKILTNGFRLEDFKYRYQELMNQILLDVIKWDALDAEFANAEINNEGLAEIRISELLLKSVKHCVSFNEITAELKADTILSQTPLFETLVNEFKFSPEESQLISKSHEGIHIGTLLVTAGTVDEKSLRFLYLLKQIGMLETAKTPATAKERSFFDDLVAEPSPRPIPMVEQMKEAEDSFHKPAEQEMIAVTNPVRIEAQPSKSKIEITRLDMEAERRFEMARHCYNQQKFWEAANYCEQAAGIHEDARYYWLMGLAYAQHPKFRSKADDCFHHAIHIDPLNDELHVELAEFYVDHGMPLRARTHCQMAMGIVPDQERAKEILANLNIQNLGVGGCPCEHKPGCQHEHKR